MPDLFGIIFLGYSQFLRFYWKTQFLVNFNLEFYNIRLKFECYLIKIINGITNDKINIIK